MEKEITIEIKNPEIILLLAFLFFVFFLELRITFSNPIAFGDEAGHTFVAKWIAEKKDFIITAPLYGGNVIGGWKFDRPPLWHLLQSGFYSLFGFNESIVKFLVPFIAFLTGLATYLLVSKIYSKNIALIAAMITVTLPSFVTYSVLFYVDVLFVFYFLLGVLFTFLAIKTNEKKHWLLAGIFLSFSLLTKTPGYLIFPFLVSVFIFQVFEKRKFFDTFKHYIIPGLVIVLLLAPFFLRNYYYYGTLGPFKIREEKAPYEYESKYQFEKRIMPGEVTFFEHGIKGYAEFAYGNLWFVPLTFICGLVTLLLKKRKENILLLILLSLFLLIFYKTYQGRTEDMARYMLGSVPFVALVSSVYIEEILNFLKKYHKYLGLLLILLVIIFSYFNLAAKLNIMKGVKQFSPSFFEACKWIKNNLPENAVLLSLWGHQTTYHCERNSMWDMPELDDVILSQDIDLILSRLKFHGITHIFLQKFSIISERYSQGYWIGFVQVLENNPQHFKKVFENGPSLEQCLRQGGCDGNIVYEIKF